MAINEILRALSKLHYPFQGLSRPPFAIFFCHFWLTLTPSLFCHPSHHLDDIIYVNPLFFQWIIFDSPVRKSKSSIAEFTPPIFKVVTWFCFFILFTLFRFVYSIFDKLEWRYIWYVSPSLLHFYFAYSPLRRFIFSLPLYFIYTSTLILYVSVTLNFIPYIFITLNFIL